MQRIWGLQLSSLKYVAIVETKSFTKNKSKKMFPTLFKRCVFATQVFLNTITVNCVQYLNP